MTRQEKYINKVENIRNSSINKLNVQIENSTDVQEIKTLNQLKVIIFFKSKKLIHKIQGGF